MRGLSHAATADSEHEENAEACDDADGDEEDDRDGVNGFHDDGGGVHE